MRILAYPMSFIGSRATCPPFLIGYRLCWDLIRGKCQSDLTTPAIDPFLIMTHTLLVRVLLKYHFLPNFNSSTCIFKTYNLYVFQEFIEEDRPELADYWGKKFNDRLKLVENELKLKNQKTTNRFEMLRDVLDEKSENAESFTDTPTTLTDNAEETIMIKGRVPRTGFIFRVNQL